jgi:hypothetical protein
LLAGLCATTNDNSPSGVAGMISKRERTEREINLGKADRRIEID